MSILRRIQQMRASLSGGSFLLEASGDLAAGDTLLIVKTSGAHQELPEEVTVTERGDGSFKLADEIMVVAGGKITQRGSREEILPGLLRNFQSGCAYRRGEAAL